MKPLIYIAGPYFDPDPLVIALNILTANGVAATINLSGLAVCLVPHNISHQIQFSLTESDWADVTMRLMRICNGALFYTFTGPTGRFSKNTSLENTEALRIKKPVWNWDGVTPPFENWCKGLDVSG